VIERRLSRRFESIFAFQAVPDLVGSDEERDPDHRKNAKAAEATRLQSQTSEHNSEAAQPQRRRQFKAQKNRAQTSSTSEGNDEGERSSSSSDSSPRVRPFPRPKRDSRVVPEEETMKVGKQLHVTVEDEFYACKITSKVNNDGTYNIQWIDDAPYRPPEYDPETGVDGRLWDGNNGQGFKLEDFRVIRKFRMHNHRAAAQPAPPSSQARASALAVELSLYLQEYHVLCRETRNFVNSDKLIKFYKLGKKVLPLTKEVKLDALQLHPLISRDLSTDFFLMGNRLKKIEDIVDAMYNNSAAAIRSVLEPSGWCWCRHGGPEWLWKGAAKNAKWRRRPHGRDAREPSLSDFDEI